jgi:DNA-binding beta-propeller fold protein YncE
MTPHRTPLASQIRKHLLVERLEDRLSPSRSYLLVDSWNSNNVLRYNEKTGAFVDEFVKSNSGDLYSSVAMDFGPNHNLYVSNGRFGKQNQPKDVPEFDGATGAFLGDFVKNGTLSNPAGVIFGHDGNIYVADRSNNMGRVQRFDGKTGAFLDTFVALGSGGLGSPSDLLFGPHGNLYVIDAMHSQILRFDGKTGAFLDTFVAPGSGGLENPLGLAFGPDGNLYVANSRFFASTGGGILRYNGRTGAFMDTFVTPGSGGLDKPLFVIFGPKGDLYVASADTTNSHVIAIPGTNTVLRYDGKTGGYLNTFVTPDSGGLRFPTALLFTQTDPVTRNYIPGRDESGTNEGDESGTNEGGETETNAVPATAHLNLVDIAASGTIGAAAPAPENTVALTSFGQARMSDTPLLGTMVGSATPNFQPVLPELFGGPNLSASLRGPTSPGTTERSIPAYSDTHCLLEDLVSNLVPGRRR